MSNTNYELDEEYSTTTPDTAHDLGEGLRRHFPEIETWLWSNTGRSAMPVMPVVALVLGALMFGMVL